MITVPLAPPAVVSMILVVRLTRRSSWSSPSRSAQYSRVWPHWLFRMQPPGTHTHTHTHMQIHNHTHAVRSSNLVYKVIKVYKITLQYSVDNKYIIGSISSQNALQRDCRSISVSYCEYTAG